jgi:ribosomal protein S18 acetylase RimI-like enzyme
VENKVLIRPATVDDSAGLARVQVDSYRTAYAAIWSQELLDHFTYEEQKHDWQEWHASRPDDLIFVADASGTSQVVGYALTRPGPTDIAPYDSELLALHVHPTRYRQGIGRRLVAAAARQLKRQGCASMMLWTMKENDAHGFYRRLGAQLLDAGKISGTGAVEVAYGWPVLENLIQAASADTDDHQQSTNKDLLQAINAAYDEPPTPEEMVCRQAMREKQKRLVKGEW